jgi:hypothetical protein
MARRAVPRATFALHTPEMPVTDNVLRPRSATELVDAAVQLLRSHYGSFVIVSGIGMIPFLLLKPMLTRLVGADGSNITPSAILPFFLIIILTSVWHSLAGAAIVAAGSQGYLEGHIDVGAAISRVAKRVPAVLYSSFAKGVAIVLGAFLLLVGAVYMYATYFAVPTTVVLEDLGGLKGCDRSKQLAAGHRWTVLKPMALVFLIYWMIGGAGSIVATMIFGATNTIATDIITTLVTVLVYPIVPITEMLVYYDLRIRSEGYDVEVAVSQLDGSGAAPA